MEIREIAERVLFSDSLEEKLRPGPINAADLSPGPAILLPDAPGRPPELRVSKKGVRVDFPGAHRLYDDRERGVMLHFLGNHELLAAELMALVLLRFPDAPKEYRAGVYEAMREEQSHALMYIRRMQDCGIAFGELPVNDHFWRLVAPMETPMEFVTRLNLTFEQANLDFSKHYATLFRQVGDDATAAVLEKIHQDEIGHVGHGLKWFRRWKARGESDWQAFHRALIFPLTPARAKGVAPFNAESRRRAGLDEEFIRNLEFFEHSRGRTPVVHWFNPNAESHARKAASTTGKGPSWQPDKTAVALENDLETLMLGCCRRDDAVLLRRPPSLEFLAGLKQAGFEIPELVTFDKLSAGTFGGLGDSGGGRKLGGLRPWAWSPDASELFKSSASSIAPAMTHQWREPIPPAWLSKQIGLQLEQSLGAQPETGVFLNRPDRIPGDPEGSDSRDALDLINQVLATGRQVLLKAPFSHAGKGHLRVNQQSDPAKTSAWVRNTFAAHGGLVVEPWLDRILDFSALYEMQPNGRVMLLGLTHMENDNAGRFLGIRVGPKWGNLLPPELASFLLGESEALKVYGEEIPAQLSRLLPGYIGPLGVDALVHRMPNGTLALKRVVELNVRYTMGRIAWEWMKHQPKPVNSRLRILRKAKLTEEDFTRLRKESGLFLNDPRTATTFLAHWQPV